MGTMTIKAVNAGNHSQKEKKNFDHVSKFYNPQKAKKTEKWIPISDMLNGANDMGERAKEDDSIIKFPKETLSGDSHSRKSSGGHPQKGWNYFQSMAPESREHSEEKIQKKSHEEDSRHQTEAQAIREVAGREETEENEILIRTEGDSKDLED